MNYKFDEVVDLTHDLTNGMPIYPGDPAPSFESYATLEKNGVNLTRLVLGSHTGTHMDAPKHFIPGGISIDKIPAKSLIGEAYVADLSQLPLGSGIKADDLTSRLDRVSLKDVILICYTGCSNHWLEENMRKNYTYLTGEASDYLVSRGVRGVGIDFLSVEAFGAKEAVSHKKLLGNGIFIIESISEAVSRFLGKRILLICLPLRLEGGDGAPSRVLAVPIS